MGGRVNMTEEELRKLNDYELLEEYLRNDERELLIGGTDPTRFLSRRCSGGYLNGKLTSLND
jgi:hypothetical protein